MKFKHLKIGWKDKNFESRVGREVDFQKDVFKLCYHDIKISSKGNDCLIIFKYKGEK